jgi:NAD(P)H dehydrogenase (quinone)
VRASAEQRQAWLADYAERLGSIHNESPIAVGEY